MSRMGSPEGTEERRSRIVDLTPEEEAFFCVELEDVEDVEEPEDDDESLASFDSALLFLGISPRMGIGVGNEMWVGGSGM